MIVVRLCSVFHLVPHSTIPFDCGYREVDDYLKWQDISCMHPSSRCWLLGTNTSSQYEWLEELTEEQVAFCSFSPCSLTKSPASPSIARRSTSRLSAASCTTANSPSPRFPAVWKRRWTRTRSIWRWRSASRIWRTRSTTIWSAVWGRRSWIDIAGRLIARIGLRCAFGRGDRA